MNERKHSLLLNFWTMTKNRIFLFTNICWKQEKFSSYCIWLCVFGNGWLKDRQCLTQYFVHEFHEMHFIVRQGKISVAKLNLKSRTFDILDLHILNLTTFLTIWYLFYTAFLLFNEPSIFYRFSKNVCYSWYRIVETNGHRWAEKKR